MVFLCLGVLSVEAVELFIGLYAIFYDLFEQACK